MASPSKKFVIPKKKRTSNPEKSEASVKAEPREEPEYVSPLKRGVKREREDEGSSSSSKAHTEEDYLKLMESKSGFSISRKEELPKGDWLTKEYSRLKEERKRAGEVPNPEPTIDEILKQERMPQNLEGFIDPIKMWVRHEGDSKVPGYNRDLLPEKRPKKAKDAPPSPPPKMDFSISQYRDEFETSPSSDKENYVVKIHESYVVRVPERLVRRMEENNRREASRGDRGRGRGRGGRGGGGGMRGRGRGSPSHNRYKRDSSRESSPSVRRRRPTDGSQGSHSPRSPAYERGYSPRSRGSPGARDSRRYDGSPRPSYHHRSVSSSSSGRRPSGSGGGGYRSRSRSPPRGDYRERSSSTYGSYRRDRSRSPPPQSHHGSSHHRRPRSPVPTSSRRSPSSRSYRDRSYSRSPSPPPRTYGEYRREQR